MLQRESCPFKSPVNYSLNTIDSLIHWLSLSSTSSSSLSLHHHLHQHFLTDVLHFSVMQIQIQIKKQKQMQIKIQKQMQIQKTHLTNALHFSNSVARSWLKVLFNFTILSSFFFRLTTWWSWWWLYWWWRWRWWWWWSWRSLWWWYSQASSGSPSVKSKIILNHHCASFQTSKRKRERFTSDSLSIADVFIFFTWLLLTWENTPMNVSPLRIFHVWYSPWGPQVEGNILWKCPPTSYFCLQLAVSFSSWVIDLVSLSIWVLKCWKLLLLEAPPACSSSICSWERSHQIKFYENFWRNSDRPLYIVYSHLVDLCLLLEQPDSLLQVPCALSLKQKVLPELRLLQYQMLKGGWAGELGELGLLEIKWLKDGWGVDWIPVRALVTTVSNS